MPTSMTTAPSFIHSPFTISAFPVPTTRMSAFFTFTEETDTVSASPWTFSPCKIIAKHCKKNTAQSVIRNMLARVFRAFKRHLCMGKKKWSERTRKRRRYFCWKVWSFGVTAGDGGVVPQEEVVHRSSDDLTAPDHHGVLAWYWNTCTHAFNIQFLFLL